MAEILLWGWGNRHGGPARSGSSSNSSVRGQRRQAQRRYDDTVDIGEMDNMEDDTTGLDGGDSTSMIQNQIDQTDSTSLGDGSSTNTTMVNKYVWRNGKREIIRTQQDNTDGAQQQQQANGGASAVSKRITSMDVQGAFAVLKSNFNLSDVHNYFKSNVVAEVPITMTNATTGRDKDNYTDMVLQECVRYLFNDPIFTANMRTKLISIIASTEQVNVKMKVSDKPDMYDADDTAKANSFMPMLCELIAAVRLHVRREDDVGGHMTMVNNNWRRVISHMMVIRDAILFARDRGFIKALQFDSDTMHKITMRYQLVKSNYLNQLFNERSKFQKISGTKNTFDKKLNEIKKSAALVNAEYEESKETTRRLEEGMHNITDSDVMALQVLRKIADLDPSNKEHFKTFLTHSTVAQHRSGALINALQYMTGLFVTTTKS